MVSWKVALVVVIIVALVMTIGVWLGYRYVSEHDDISPEGRREDANTMDSHLDELCMFAPALVRISEE